MLLVVEHADNEYLNMLKSQQPINKVKPKGHIHEHAHV